MDGLKVFLEDLKGKSLIDWWGDVPRVGNTSSEALGYPTQKPEALLERIIKSSSNQGDIVADFFCGCGTTIAAAQSLKRHWLGVDISHLAIGLIERRLLKRYKQKIKETFEIEGFPKDIGSAKQLAEGVTGGRLKFQDWIIEAMLGGIHNPKKTADGGWDGHLTFEIPNKKEIVLIEVKSGNVNVKNLREFVQVINKQNAAIGIFVCFKEQVTKPMQLEAKDAGYYSFNGFTSNIDKIQIVTVEQLLDGILPNIPESTKQTFKTAQMKTTKGAEQQTLSLE